MTDHRNPPDLLQLKALKASLGIQKMSLPSSASRSEEARDLEYTIYLLDSEITALETRGMRTGLNVSQQEAIARYQEYGLLIEQLRDAANGNLPECFTTLGNLLARYRDSGDDPHCDFWIWTLENILTAFQKELEWQQAKKRCL